MIWTLSHHCDPGGRVIADRHYNRQHVGAPNFVPPGRCLVLTAPSALWVTSWPFAEFVRHRWGGAWVNSLFRREGGDMQASEMTRAAVAATRWKWPHVPALGMITFVDRSKTQNRSPGVCYRHAGFERDGETEGGLIAWRLRPEAMPAPEPPYGATLGLNFGCA